VKEIRGGNTLLNIKSLGKLLDIKIKNKDIFETAFTHRSYLNEHPSYKNPSNERLEFLGDSILQFLASEYLYDKYQDAAEGDMTNYRSAVVNTVSLAEESERLGFGDYLLLSRGEEATGGRKREYILANTFEAVLGGLYLESDLDTVNKFLIKNLFYKIQKIIDSKEYKDYKSNFQEISQDKFGVTPSYKVLKEEGPDHQKEFTVAVYKGKKKMGEGLGSSKQRGEQEAARNALEKLSKSC